MLAQLLPDLRCPVCAGPLAAAGRAVRCPRGHSFDVARQGYLNLLAGRAPGGDDAAQVAARAQLLDSGAFDFVSRALAAHCADAGDGLVVDLGGGTGHHLAAVLDALPAARGLALDVSKAAARRAARAHPRAASVVCDAWRGLPLGDGRAALVLDVFAPRNGAEFHRVLCPGGALLVVTPRADHLAELVSAFGLLTVDPDKDVRLSRTLDRWFRSEGSWEYAHELTLSPADALTVVAMGPSARHRSPADLAAIAGTWAAPKTVTAAVRVGLYRRREDP
ncbi:putative RNA methyltransferase [Luedemannella helvata]|uniref:Methyltransferase domain-containing protein n=1 Tax=Luedemannella helvata TaxID=349315 RepID=A0ABP4VTK3_9ACTN